MRTVAYAVSSAIVYTKLGIVDPQKLTPISVMLQSPLVLVVPASSPIKTYAQSGLSPATRGIWVDQPLQDERCAEPLFM
ncbi:hypothetical protein CBM2634_U10027 [Cupriavidus taiwanensis]|uniref:Uncharacterized protein n=1 Tax=Cupriavidus taiwanensis TaxID=164546 RepID=A0A375JFM8_9BURK|nr:hypothetical protein CBM2634_U10027 [Cupriavidus taiwanensis]